MRLNSALLSLTLGSALSLSACSEGQSYEEFLATSQEIVQNGVEVTLRVTSDWGGGYCADVSLKNQSSSTVTNWAVILDLNGSTSSGPWNGVPSGPASNWRIGPAGYNQTIAPGQTASFGFCATSPNAQSRAILLSAQITGGGTGGGGSGGSSGSGGATGSGGSSGSGGAMGSGGSIGSGGSSSGGTTGSGGTSGGSGGTAGSGGTGGSGGSCSIPEPPSNMRQTIDLTWQEMTGQLAHRGAGARAANSSVLQFRNTILDQVRETGGTLNYCVRYESTVPVTATQRDKLEAALERGINEWFDKLKGHDCYPHERIDVKVTGWAAMSRSTFQWQDGEHPGLMYIGDSSFENAPQCAQACGRFFNRQAGFQYPGCQGGRANHYDMSLWLTEGMNGGAGGDWGNAWGAPTS